jgi:two-component system LytT family response regulator
MNAMDSYQHIQTLLENLLSPEGEIQKLVISDLNGFSVIRISDIIYLEADRYCTDLHITGNTKITSSKNLGYYLELLPPEQFMRVHNSYIINIRKVTGYTNQGEILLAENLRCPLSTTHKHQFLKHFRKFK